MVKPLKVLKIDAGAQGALLNFHLQQKLILKIHQINSTKSNCLSL